MTKNQAGTNPPCGCIDPHEVKTTEQNQQSRTQQGTAIKNYGDVGSQTGEVLRDVEAEGGAERERERKKEEESAKARIEEYDVRWLAQRPLSLPVLSPSQEPNYYVLKTPVNPIIPNILQVEFHLIDKRIGSSRGSAVKITIKKLRSRMLFPKPPSHI